MDRHHHTGHGWVRTATGPDRMQRGQRRGFGDNAQQVSALKEERTQLGRNGKCQMPVLHIEQTSLCIGGSFLCASLSARGAKAAFATEMNLVRCVAIRTPILRKAHLVCSTTKRLFNRCLSSSRNRWRKTRKHILFHKRPMVAQYLMQKARSVTIHTRLFRGFTFKMALFFL